MTAKLINALKNAIDRFSFSNLYKIELIFIYNMPYVYFYL